MNPDTVQICKTLADELVAECTSEGWEQIQLIGVKGNGRTLVLVCTTDTATEAVLEFLDSQLQNQQTERMSDG